MVKGFFKKRSLLEQELATLSVDELSLLQRGLMVKLIRVNEEIASRCEDLAALGSEIESASDAVGILKRSSARCISLNKELNLYFDRATSGEVTFALEWRAPSKVVSALPPTGRAT